MSHKQACISNDTGIKLFCKSYSLTFIVNTFLHWPQKSYGHNNLFIRINLRTYTLITNIKNVQCARNRTIII